MVMAVSLLFVCVGSHSNKNVGGALIGALPFWVTVCGMANENFKDFIVKPSISERLPLQSTVLQR
jgi:hypothetical protein